MTPLRLLRLLSIIVLASFAANSAISPASAEFAVGGEGKFKETTKEASAKFHEALASFHLLMGALDRGDTEAAQSLRGRAVEQFVRAAEVYRTSSEYASQRVLKPIPGGPQDRAYIDYFRDHARIYQVNLDSLSEKSLVGATSRIIGYFSDAISKMDLGLLRENVAARQNFLQIALDIETFLNSASTVLRVG